MVTCMPVCASLYEIVFTFSMHSRFCLRGKAPQTVLVTCGAGEQPAGWSAACRVGRPKGCGQRGQVAGSYEGGVLHCC